MGKSYEQRQSWQQFGSAGNIPKANESILFIQCFLTFPQRPRSQIVHFLSWDKISQACHKYRRCNCQPRAVRLKKKRQYFCLFSLFLLKMALVTSWLLSKMNSVTVPMLCTRQWRAKIRFQMCPTYVSKYCNTDKYFSAIYSQNTKLLSRAALCCTIWLLLCFCLSAFLFIRT